MVGGANDRSGDKMGCLVEPPSCSNYNIDSAVGFVSGYSPLFLAASAETVCFCVLLLRKWHHNSGP